MGAQSKREDSSTTVTIKHLISNAKTASLATIGENGYPFVSLTSLAFLDNGNPVLLLSDLALHTRNINQDRRASLLLTAQQDERGADAKLAMAQSRLTLSGQVSLCGDQASAGSAFLTRNPEAREYSGFQDFQFYALVVEAGHLVAGFGRIVSLKGDKLSKILANGPDRR